MQDSRLTNAIQTLVGVFHEYACKDEEGKKPGVTMDHFKLSKKELKELLLKELNFDDVKDGTKMNEMMASLDADGDGQVDFQEFVTFVACMSCICNDFLETILSEEAV